MSEKRPVDAIDVVLFHLAAIELSSESRYDEVLDAIDEAEELVNALRAAKVELDGLRNTTTVTVPRDEWEETKARAGRLNQISLAAKEAWSLYKSHRIDHQRYLELVSNAVDQHTPYDDENTPTGKGV